MFRWQIVASVAVLIVVATLGTGLATGSVSGGDVRVVTSDQTTATQIPSLLESDNRAAGGATLAQTDGEGPSPEGNSSDSSVSKLIGTILFALLMGTVVGGIAVGEYSKRQGKLSRIDEHLAAAVRDSKHRTDRGQNGMLSRGPEQKAKFVAEQVEILREKMDSNRSAGVKNRDGYSQLSQACQRVRDDANGLQEGGTAESLLSALEAYRGADSASPERLEQQLSVVVDELTQHEQPSEPTPEQGCEIVDADPEKDIRDDRIAKQEQKIRELEDEKQNLKRNLDKKEQLVRTLERKFDTAWLQEQIDASDSETRIRRAAELGKIDTAIIQQAAESVGPAGSVEGQELIRTLEGPQSEQQVRDELSTAVERLSGWEQVAKQVEAADKEDIRRRISVLRSQTPGSSGTLKGIDNLLEVCENDLERTTERNSVELHSLKITLDRIERATQTTESSLEGSHWQELSAETDRLREELDNLTQKGKLGISRGHQLSEVFIEVADELTAEARNSAEDGDWDVARAQLEAAERIYEAVKRLYDNSNLRQLLQ